MAAGGALRRCVVAGLAVAAVLLLSPAGKVTVPDVAGQSEQSAGHDPAPRGPEPRASAAAELDRPDGPRDQPVAGRRHAVEKGSRVDLVVSGGPASAPVTDVEGLTEAEALKKLRKAGFKPHVTKEASATVAAGQVIGTNPPAGTIEQLGSRVPVLVSSGPGAGQGART